MDEYMSVENLFSVFLSFFFSQIGKQGKPVQVYSFSQNPLRAIFLKLLVGATSPIPFERYL